MPTSEPTAEQSPDDSAASLDVIGIVCALHLEVAPFLERCQPLHSDSGNGFKYRGVKLNEQRICVVEGGTGMERARLATQALIDAFAPRWILSVGFSGGLQEQVRSGEIVVGTEHCDAQGQQRLSIDLGLPTLQQPGLHFGPLCTSDHIVRLIEEKRKLAQHTGALAVDMESLGVAQVCRQRQVRFLSIRAISDDLSADLPPEVLSLLGPKGTVRAGALFGSILKRPGSVKDLWGLREKAVQASERLATFLESLLPQLSAADRN